MKRLLFLIYTACIISLIYSNGCSSPEKIITKKPVGETIPPGSAVVLCNVNSFTENGDVYLIDVSVKSVLGYGSATDEIAPGANMKLQMAKRLIEIKSLKNGTELHVEIKQPKMRMESDKSAAIWTVAQLVR